MKRLVDIKGVTDQPEFKADIPVSETTYCTRFGHATLIFGASSGKQFEFEYGMFETGSVGKSRAHVIWSLERCFLHKAKETYREKWTFVL